VASRAVRIATTKETPSELAHAEAALAISEKTLAQSQDAKAGLEARRAALEATIQEESQRLGRLLAEIESVRQEHGALTSISTAEADISALQMTLDETLATAMAREEEAAMQSVSMPMPAKKK
jgi:chromosome segregation protein